MKFIDLNFENKKAQKKSKEIFNSIEKQGQYLLGENLKKFESEFANDQEKKYCIGVKNATDALTMVFQLLEANKKTVIVPQFGAYPTVIAALQAGAKKIIAAPVDEKFCLYLNDIEVPPNSILVPVNLFGNQCDIGTLNQIAIDSNSLIVEDCAQSTGIPVKNFNSIVASIHSFYPTKPLGCRGDGGAILTNDDLLFEKSKKARFYGFDENGIINSWGFNSRMDEWQAGFLSGKISYYRDLNLQRRKNAFKFNKALENKNLSNQTAESVYHQYTILCKDREFTFKKLKEGNIPAIIHYPKLISEMPYIADKIISMPCKKINEHILSIPVGAHLNKKDIELITNTLSDIKNETIQYQEIK
jgi:dTDP-4-amino-4,6-dideoxygalactose transaminase